LSAYKLFGISAYTYTKGEVDLIAPSLLFYEVANALRYNPRFGIKSALAAFEDLGITIHDLRREL